MRSNLGPKVLVWGCLLAGCSGSDEKPADVGDTDDNTPGPTTPPPTTPPPAGIDADSDGFASDIDCDDSDPDTFPGAPDLCGDGLVTDCNRSSDNGLVTLDGALGFSDLAAALEAASEGSEILLCPGTYTGAFVAAVAVTLTSLDGAEVTTLAGAGDSVLQIPGGSAIVGLTISGGSAQTGGGVRMTTPGSLSIEGSTILDNEANFGGGLFVAEDSEVVLTDTRIEDNQAFGAGGVQVSAGSTLDLTANGTISGNRATAYGAGVWLDSAHLIGGQVVSNEIDEYYYPYYYYGLPDLDGYAYGGAGVATTGISSLTQTEIANNQSLYGGGLSVTAGQATAIDTLVHDNTAVQLGGGAAVWGGDLVLQGVTELSENYGGEAAGGAIVVFGSMSGGTVRDNTGGEYAGGVFAVQSVIADMTVEDNRSGMGAGLFAIGIVDLSGVIARGNQGELGGGLAASEEYGNYFYDYTPTEVTVTDSFVSDNEAQYGGGVYAGWSFVLSNTEISDNVAEFGAGIYAAANVSATGGAIVRNVASDRGGGVVNGDHFAATDVDFGSDADDNVPSDVDNAAMVYTDYGAATTITCDSESCEP